LGLKTLEFYPTSQGPGYSKKDVFKMSKGVASRDLLNPELTKYRKILIESKHDKLSYELWPGNS